MITYTKDQAKAVDAKLAEDQKSLYKASERMNSAVSALARDAGARGIYIGRQRYLSFDGRTIVTAEEAIERATAALEDDAVQQRTKNSIQQWMGSLTAYRADVDKTTALVDAAHKEWTNHGKWSRFFLVAGGHIHSSTACHTLKLTTRLGWLPALSGETEKDAVDAHGALLCTVCFPSAPVEWTVGAKPADDQCEGGVPSDTNFRLRSPYGTCPSCGEYVSVTSTGKARKHKKSAK